MLDSKINFPRSTPPATSPLAAHLGGPFFLTNVRSCTILNMEFSDMIWSPSRINTLFSCPRKFYYQYVLGQSGEEERSEAAELGKATHELLEISVLGKPVSDFVFEVADKYQLSIDSRRELLEMVPNIEKFSETVRNHPEVIKVATELEVRNGVFKGILDLTIHFVGDHFFVIDHKTTRINISSPEAIPWDYANQLNIYGYLISSKIPSAKISTGIYLVRFGKTIKVNIAKPPEYYREKVKDLASKAQNVLKRENGVWTPRPSWKCRFCQYRKTCEAVNQFD